MAFRILGRKIRLDQEDKIWNKWLALRPHFAEPMSYTDYLEKHKASNNRALNQSEKQAIDNRIDKINKQMKQLKAGE